MTQCVIDVLEPVEVEQRDRGRRDAVSGQETAQLLLYTQTIGQPGQLIVMCEPLQLLLCARVFGDVFIGARDASHRAVWIVHRRGGHPYIDRGAILAQPLHAYILQRFAAKGALEHILGFIRLLWRHQVSELAYRLLGGIAEYLLSRPAPQKNAALRIGTDNRDRRGIDDGCQGLLRAGTLDGFGGGGFTRLVKLLVASL